jgi:hypothetical protein
MRGLLAHSKRLPLGFDRKKIESLASLIYLRRVQDSSSTPSLVWMFEYVLRPVSLLASPAPRVVRHCTDSQSMSIDSAYDLRCPYSTGFRDWRLINARDPMDIRPNDLRACVPAWRLIGNRLPVGKLELELELETGC